MRISLSRKVTGLVVLGIFLIGAALGRGLFFARDVSEVLEEGGTVSRRAALAGELALQVDRLLTPVRNYMVTGDAGERDRFDVALADLSQTFSQLRKLPATDGSVAAAAAVERDAVALGESAVDLLHLAFPVIGAQPELAEFDRNAAALLADLNRFEMLAMELRATHAHQAAERLRGGRRLVALALVIALVYAFLFYFYLRRALMVPLGRLHRGVGRIGGGDLGHRIAVKTGDELEDLGDEFNRMAASLQQAQRELAERLRELSILYEVTTILPRSFDLQQPMLEMVAGRVAAGLGLQVTLLMVHADTGKLMVVARAPSLHADSPASFAAEGALAEALATDAAGARLISAGALPPELVPGADQQIAVAPIRARDRTLGLIVATGDGGQAIRERELRVLSVVADHVALAQENVQLFADARHQAITDGLTGLYNKRYLSERLGIEQARAGRHGQKLSVALFDLDNFKHYNDTHGHPEGDELLRQLAEVLRNLARKEELLARYGGEEFVLLMPDTSKEAALQAAERLRRTIAGHPFPHAEQQPLGLVSASVGVATLPDDADSVEALLLRADEALYVAKRQGRNRVAAA